jgi:hypothetical protein
MSRLVPRGRLRWDPHERDTVKTSPLTIPAGFAAVLVLLAGFAAFLVWDQWVWWTTREEYMFGFLVPLFVA